MVDYWLSSSHVFLCFGWPWDCPKFYWAHVWRFSWWLETVCSSGVSVMCSGWPLDWLVPNFIETISSSQIQSGAVGLWLCSSCHILCNKQGPPSDSLLMFATMETWRHLKTLNETYHPPWYWLCVSTIGYELSKPVLLQRKNWSRVVNMIRYTNTGFY